MPVKWTPDNNELLLVKILETSNTTFDCDAIAASWPTDKGERPTARAIRERLVKIRANVKAKSDAGHFTVGIQTRTPKATPKKPTPAKSATKSRSRPKSKTAEDDDNNARLVKAEDDASPPVTPTPVAKRKRAEQDVNGSDDADGDGEDGGIELPSEKKRKSYTMAWLPEEDWKNVKEDPTNESIFAYKEYEEDQKAAKSFGGFDGAGDVESDDDCVIVEKSGS